jgi:alkylhydroperoxidase family enzyme
MAWIEKVPIDEADGLLKRVFEAAIKRAGKVFQILHVQSQNPKTLQAGIGLYSSIMHGESPLTRAQREMLATVVSHKNDCHY